MSCWLWPLEVSRGHWAPSSWSSPSRGVGSSRAGWGPVPGPQQGRRGPLARLGPWAEPGAQSRGCETPGCLGAGGMRMGKKSGSPVVVSLLRSSRSSQDVVGSKMSLFPLWVAQRPPRLMAQTWPPPSVRPQKGSQQRREQKDLFQVAQRACPVLLTRGSRGEEPSPEGGGHCTPRCSPRGAQGVQLWESCQQGTEGSKRPRDETASEGFGCHREPRVKLFHFHRAQVLGSAELPSSPSVVKAAHAQKFLQGMDARTEQPRTKPRVLSPGQSVGRPARGQGVGMRLPPARAADLPKAEAQRGALSRAARCPPSSRPSPRQPPDSRLLCAVSPATHPAQELPGQADP